MSRFDDFNRKFDRDQRRFDIMFRVVVGLVAAIWIVVIAGFIAAAVMFVRMGPEGLAAEAGRLLGAVERGWESAR